MLKLTLALMLLVPTVALAQDQPRNGPPQQGYRDRDRDSDRDRDRHRDRDRNCVYVAGVRMCR